MTDQLTLAYNDSIAGRSRASDPVSSQAAARSCNAEGERARIAECLRSARGRLTVAQIVARTGIPRDHVASRLPVMARRGQAVLAGMAENEQGRPVQEWVVAV